MKKNDLVTYKIVRAEYKAIVEYKEQNVMNDYKHEIKL